MQIIISVADPDSDPIPDPTPFFSYFKDAKENNFFLLYIFSNLQSLLLKFLCQNFILEALLSPLNIFMRRGKDPGPDPFL